MPKKEKKPNTEIIKALSWYDKIKQENEWLKKRLTTTEGVLRNLRVRLNDENNELKGQLIKRLEEINAAQQQLEAQRKVASNYQNALEHSNQMLYAVLVASGYTPKHSTLEAMIQFDLASALKQEKEQTH